jgi:hypothetical protein
MLLTTTYDTIAGLQAHDTCMRLFAVRGFVPGT